MDIKQSVSAFSALGQDTRLAVVRLLIQAGNAGMCAGDIAVKLSVRQNTMSANLKILNEAGLVRNERHGREIRYYADFLRLRDLLAFLMEDCCRGEAKLCQPVLEQIFCDCVEARL